MYVMCNDKVVDLSKFDGVEISRGASFEGYVVNAVKGSSNEEAFRMEIVQFNKEADAIELIRELSACWVRKYDYFDIVAYLDDVPCSGFYDMIGV